MPFGTGRSAPPLGMSSVRRRPSAPPRAGCARHQGAPGPRHQRGGAAAVQAEAVPAPNSPQRVGHFGDRQAVRNSGEPSSESSSRRLPSRRRSRRRSARQRSRRRGRAAARRRAAPGSRRARSGTGRATRPPPGGAGRSPGRRPTACATAARPPRGPTRTVLPRAIGPAARACRPTATTRPSRTVTSWVSVLQGAPGSVSVPQVARTRDALPQSLVNAPTEPTGSAYWLSPPSGSRLSGGAHFDPSRRGRPGGPGGRSPRRARPRCVTPGGIAGPKRWPFGTAPLRARPLATAGPTGAPVASTPGCWVSVMLKKSPLIAADRALTPSASADTAARAPDRTRIEQIDAACAGRSGRRRAHARGPCRARRGCRTASTPRPARSATGRWPAPCTPPAGAAPIRAAPASVPNAVSTESAALPF